MPRDDEAERYRKAAGQALSQLDWCVGYLRRIHKQRLAAQIAKSSAAIRRRLGEPAGRDTR
jgi:hypothetical protein